MFLENTGNISYFHTASHSHAQYSIIIFSYINDRHVQFTVPSYRVTGRPQKAYKLLYRLLYA